MLQYFETLTDDSGNSLLGATCQALTYPGNTAAAIYNTNGTSSPVANSTVASDITGQISFYVPDGDYTLIYSYKGAVYKTKSPVPMLDPMGFVAITDTGTVNAIVLTDPRLPSQLYVGLKAEFKAADTNLTSVTLNFNGTGIQPINLPGGSGLTAGMIQAAGLYRIEWDGTQWQFYGGQSQVNYPATQAEQSFPIVPTNLAYPASPYIDPRRYSVTGSALAATPVDDTTTMQNELNFAYSCSGWTQLWENCHILNKGLEVVFTGNRQTNAYKLVGVTNVSSTFNQTGDTIANDSILIFANNNTTDPFEANILLEDFGVVGTDFTVGGLQIQNIALVEVNRIQASFCSVGIKSFSALITSFNGCIVESNVCGYQFREYGTSSGANAVTINRGLASGCLTFGIDLGGSATDIQISGGIVIEGNGTGGTATSGSTTTIVDTTQNWTPNVYAGYKVVVTVSGTQYFSEISANSATTLTFAAIAAPVVATDPYFIGGGIILREGLEGTFGFTTLGIDGIHVEANQGWGLYTEQMSGLTLGISNSLFTGGNCISVQGGGVSGTLVHMKNCNSPASGDTWSFSATVGAVTLESCNCAIINDKSVISEWSNVTTASGGPFDARPNTATLTLSSTYGNGTINAKQKGKTVTFSCETQIAASGSGTTITGTYSAQTVASAYIPAFTQTLPCFLVVNGANVMGTITIAATTGNITLGGVSFTTAEVNGIAAGASWTIQL